MTAFKKMYKRVRCDGPDCEQRRKHYENEKPRGPQYIDVARTYNGPYFCSIACQMYWHEAQKEKENK